MYKVFLTCVLICSLSVAAFAQEENKPAISEPASPEMAAVETAASLARYGYSNYSASALIGAAEILSQVSTQAFVPEGVERDAAADNAAAKAGKCDLSVACLIADAKTYAAGNATMLAWAESVEKSAAQGSTRGAVGGPKFARARVSSNSTVTYRINFRAGELAEVIVDGDGDTDLDVYIYDSNGNFITSDEDYTDYCVTRWRPRWTGTFLIKIKNWGNVYNEYRLWTN